MSAALAALLQNLPLILSIMGSLWKALTNYITITSGANTTAVQIETAKADLDAAVAAFQTNMDAAHAATIAGVGQPDVTVTPVPPANPPA